MAYRRRQTCSFHRDDTHPGVLLLAVLWICFVLCVPVYGEVKQDACLMQENQQTLCNCNYGQDPSVDCGNRSLTLVPTGIPADITVLMLNNNRITIIKKGDFLYLEKLRTLLLQGNQISTIEDEAFANLHHLQLLVLLGNRLTSVPATWFQHLPSIKTIDLQNNAIRSIDKRAFLTIPASNGGDLDVRMSGNNDINCDCNVRAIRDWSRSLGGNLARVQFKGFQCQGRELLSAPNSSFPSCNSSQLSMFESTQKCLSCQNALSQQECDEQQGVVCTAYEPVCQTRIQYQRSEMRIEKTCSSYAACLETERGNSRQCNVSHSGPIAYMQCNFCCVGPFCNLGDMGGRTNSFRLFVTFQMNIAYQPFMLDAASAEYQQNVAIYNQKLRDLFLRVDGGYSIKFLYFRDEAPYTRVALEIYATNLNTFTAVQVMALLNESLHQDARTGFLRTFVIPSSIYVGTELATADKCPAERTAVGSGTVLWKETNAGSTAFVSCPEQQSTDKAVFAKRICYEANGIAKWGVPDFRDCDGDDDDKDKESETTKKLKELADVEINSNNVNQVLNQLLQLLIAEDNLTSDDVSLSVNMVDRALQEGTALTQPSTTNSLTGVLSELMNVDQTTLRDANKKNSSAQRILSAVDQITSQGLLSGGKLMSSASNLVLAAQAVDAGSFSGLTVTADSQGDDVFQEGEVQIRPGADSPSKDISSLALPRTLLTSAPGSNRVAMTVHRTDKVFEAMRKSGTGDTSDGGDRKFVTKVNSHVMAASVVDQKIDNLQEPVIITLVHDNENSTNPRCVFWDEAADGGGGDWSQRGCRLLEDRSTDNVTTCACDHLTNFALLMDVYQRGEDISATDRKILSIISYIGCGVSLLALIFTLLTYFMFKTRAKTVQQYEEQPESIRKLRRDNPSKILVNLCLALALSNLIFLVGMQDYAFRTVAGCKTVAVFLHFFLLASLCWMAVEAFYMYLALVLVFKTYFTNFILKCSVVGWGVPLVIVIITLAVNETDNYGPLNSGVCWLNGVAFYAAFVAPVCLILLLNFIAFALVLRTILGLSGRKLNKSDNFSTAQQLRGAIGVVILLGLTWIFGVLAIDQASVVFYYLFAIFNSLQGLFIFIFYCLLKKEARNAWRRFCCKTGDEKSSAMTTSKAPNENTNSRGGYSGAGTTHGNKSSTTDTTSNGHATTTTTGSASSLRDIDADFSKSNDLTKDHTYENVNPSPNANGQQFKHNVKVTQISTAARPIQFTPGHTIATEKVTPSAPSIENETSNNKSGQQTTESQPSNFAQGNAKHGNTSPFANTPRSTKISISTDNTEPSSPKKVIITANASPPTNGARSESNPYANMPNDSSAGSSSENTTADSSPKSSAADASTVGTPSNPRPLRIKAGHVEVGPRASTSGYESSTSPTSEEASPTMSVADRIKMLNTRL